MLNFCNILQQFQNPRSEALLINFLIWNWFAFPVREKGITTLRIYYYWIFYHTMIKTCFEMLKFSDYEKLWCYSNFNIPIFNIVLRLDHMIPQFHFTISILRKWGPDFRWIHTRMLLLYWVKCDVLADKILHLAPTLFYHLPGFYLKTGFLNLIFCPRIRIPVLSFSLSIYEATLSIHLSSYIIYPSSYIIYLFDLSKHVNIFKAQIFGIRLQYLIEIISFT